MVFESGLKTPFVLGLVWEMTSKAQKRGNLTGWTMQRTGKPMALTLLVSRLGTLSGERTKMALLMVPLLVPLLVTSLESLLEKTTVLLSDSTKNLEILIWKVLQKVVTMDLLMDSKSLLDFEWAPLALRRGPDLWMVARKGTRMDTLCLLLDTKSVVGLESPWDALLVTRLEKVQMAHLKQLKGRQYCWCNQLI